MKNIHVWLNLLHCILSHHFVFYLFINIQQIALSCTSAHCKFSLPEQQIQIMNTKTNNTCVHCTYLIISVEQPNAKSDLATK